MTELTLQMPYAYQFGTGAIYVYYRQPTFSRHRPRAKSREVPLTWLTNGNVVVARGFARGSIHEH